MVWDTANSVRDCTNSVTLLYRPDGILYTVCDIVQRGILYRQCGILYRQCGILRTVWDIVQTVWHYDTVQTVWDTVFSHRSSFLCNWSSLIRPDDYPVVSTRLKFDNFMCNFGSLVHIKIANVQTVWDTADSVISITVQTAGDNVQAVRGTDTVRYSRLCEILCRQCEIL